MHLDSQHILLMVQKPAFSPSPPAISSQASISSHHTMAGDDQHQPVAVVGIAHRPAGIGLIEARGYFL